MINDITLLENLKHAIEKQDYFFSEACEILAKYKSNGGTKANAEQILNKLMKEYDKKEILEERALDLLEIVTGFCKSNLKIW